jgi:hypothetical protein
MALTLGRCQQPGKGGQGYLNGYNTVIDAKKRRNFLFLINKSGY